MLKRWLEKLLNIQIEIDVLCLKVIELSWDVGETSIKKNIQRLSKQACLHKTLDKEPNWGGIIHECKELPI